METIVLKKKTLKRRTIAFTLIELLTVIAIIAILAALVLAAGSGVMQKTARSRAAGEIQAMSTALEGYKTDNGIYPPGTLTSGGSSDLLGPPGGNYSPDPSSYVTASEALYLALSGQAYFQATPVAGTKTYMSFKSNQVGLPGPPNSYVKDPWGNSYGYSTGDNKSPQAQYPFNGTGFFDLWSSGNTTKDIGNNYATNAWISNWQ